MKTAGKTTSKVNQEEVTPWYRGAEVPARVMRKFVRAVVKQFRPDRVILFGSYAQGQPHADSDVDLLVVMSTRNEQDQAIRIRNAVVAPFPLDLLVRKPESIAWRLTEREAFTTEIIKSGKLLYDKKKQRVGAQGRDRLSHRPTFRH